VFDRHMGDFMKDVIYAGKLLLLLLLLSQLLKVYSSDTVTTVAVRFVLSPIFEDFVLMPCGRAQFCE